MYVLINRDKYDLIAKHPNFLTLHHLGIINCPECQEVLPLEFGMFKGWQKYELVMLYIGITLETPPDEWEYSDLEYILIHLMNEAKETLLNFNEAAAQAEYAIEWDIQGLCSFVVGAKVPSLDEGLWDNLTIDISTEDAAKLLITKRAIEFKHPMQLAFKP
jgi:hypothetical protein